MLKLLLLIILIPATVYSQETNVHPIDKSMENCIDKNASTAGTVKCTDIAYRMWDKELNKNYQTVMSKLKPADKQTLKTAQLEWLKYRDTEFKLVDTIYDQLQGTMYIPMRLGQKMEIVKRRSQALATYLDLLSESEP